MTATEVFSIANMIAMPMWVLMLFLSKWKVTRFLIDFKVIPLTLAFIYAIYIVQAVGVSGMMDFGSLTSGLRRLCICNYIIGTLVPRKSHEESIIMPIYKDTERSALSVSPSATVYVNDK